MFRAIFHNVPQKCRLDKQRHDVDFAQSVFRFVVSCHILYRIHRVLHFVKRDTQINRPRARANAQSLLQPSQTNVWRLIFMNENCLMTCEPFASCASSVSTKESSSLLLAMTNGFLWGAPPPNALHYVIVNIIVCARSSMIADAPPYNNYIIWSEARAFCAFRSWCRFAVLAHLIQWLWWVEAAVLVCFSVDIYMWTVK